MIGLDFDEVEGLFLAERSGGRPDSGQSLTVSFASVPLARKTFQ